MSNTLAAIAIGSNLGDRESHLAYARDQLAVLLTDLRVSSVIETAPVGVAGAGAHPDFLNAAAIGSTPLSARDLLTALLAIEYGRGRERPFAGAPRTLDLDLLLFGDVVIDEPGLTVPHPRFRERLFVLGPLAEIARDWRDPVTTLTVGDLLARLVVSPPAPKSRRR